MSSKTLRLSFVAILRVHTKEGGEESGYRAEE